MMPRRRELNEGKIGFQNYLSAGMCFGLDKSDLSHLHGPSMLQGKLCVIILSTLIL